MLYTSQNEVVTIITRRTVLSCDGPSFWEGDTRSHKDHFLTNECQSNVTFYMVGGTGQSDTEGQHLVCMQYGVHAIVPMC